MIAGRAKIKRPLKIAQDRVKPLSQVGCGARQQKIRPDFAPPPRRAGARQPLAQQRAVKQAGGSRCGHARFMAAGGAEVKTAVAGRIEPDRRQVYALPMETSAAPFAPVVLDDTPDPPQPLRVRLLRRWQHVRSAALNLVYPPACMVCRSTVTDAGTLCTDCWKAMRFIERPYCERLGTPFVQDLGAGLISPQAMADPPVFGRARAVALFEDGPARQLVHRLKYYDRLELAQPLGRWMARTGADLLGEAQVLVPVPLHRGRLLARQFNQAAALAAVIARHSGVPSDPALLARVKATRPQVGMSRTERANNLQGAFRVPEDRKLWLTGRRIVLVDDVLTSGATANAAARALFRGGAASVDLLVFAQVVTGA